MDPLLVLLVDNSKAEEDVCVNMDLIRLGLARLCATGKLEQEPQSSDQQTGDLSLGMYTLRLGWYNDNGLRGTFIS